MLARNGSFTLLLSACFHPSYNHPTCGPNGECPSGLICSAQLSNTCVPADDAGSDDSVERPIDGPMDGLAMIGCPSDYAAVAGSAHVYKMIAAATWDEARIACKATSTSAYLAVPDDATELMNLETTR